MWWSCTTIVWARYACASCERRNGDLATQTTVLYRDDGTAAMAQHEPDRALPCARTQARDPTVMGDERRLSTSFFMLSSKFLVKYDAEDDV